MAEHRPVTSSISAPSGTTVVHFHCPCGTDRRELIVTGPDSVHPTARFTAAIRRLHLRGQWPPTDVDRGDSAAAGWGHVTNEPAA